MNNKLNSYFSINYIQTYNDILFFSYVGPKEKISSSYLIDVGSYTNNQTAQKFRLQPKNFLNDLLTDHSNSLHQMNSNYECSGLTIIFVFYVKFQFKFYQTV